jgi:hypothetical protein
LISSYKNCTNLIATFKKPFLLGILLEARVGIEPTHKGFADLSLTTWVPRLKPIVYRTFSAKAGGEAFRVQSKAKG